MIRVAAFTGGRDVPSARFRVRQYISSLQMEGIAVVEFAARFGAYPPQSRLMRPLWAASTLAQRLPAVLLSHAYDAVLLQREMLSTTDTLERMTGRPRILDVDDAIWLNARNGFAKRLARISDCVICGSQAVQDYFHASNRRTIVIPTAVDTSRFVPPPSRPQGETVIGWSGVSASFHELEIISRALRSVLDSHPVAKLRIMADRRPDLPALNSSRQFEFVKWKPGNEVSTFQSFDIGIMPLRDTEWNRGKCSYKMLLYMACGSVPVVSPVGMNVEVLQKGQVGFAARTESEWVDCLSLAVRDDAHRSRMATEARQVVLQHYSIEAVVPLLAAAIRGVTE